MNPHPLYPPQGTLSVKTEQVSEGQIGVFRLPPAVHNSSVKVTKFQSGINRFQTLDLISLSRAYLALVLLELLTPVAKRSEDPLHLSRRPIFHLLGLQRPPPRTKLVDRLL